MKRLIHMVLVFYAVVSLVIFTATAMPKKESLPQEYKELRELREKYAMNSSYDISLEQAILLDRLLTEQKRTNELLEKLINTKASDGS